MDKFVFRNIENAPTYDVANCENGAGVIGNITLFGDEPKMPVPGARNSEANNNFHYVHRTTLPVGGSVGEHPHEGNEQFYLIIEGVGEVTLCGNVFKVKPWSIALIRSGGSHGIRNTGNVPLVYLCVETALSGEA